MKDTNGLKIHTDSFGAKVKVVTDNSNYEKIDKKERKKIYSKLNKHDGDDEETKGCADEIEESKKHSKDLVETDAHCSNAEGDQAKSEQKFRSKEIAKKEIKTHFIEGNLNRILNPIED